MKIDSQQLRAAMVCQAKNDVRYYLQGVHIFGNTIEATNGHVAVVMTMKRRVRGDWILNIKGKISKLASVSKFEFSKKESIVKHYDALGNLLQIHAVDVIDGKFPNIKKITDLKCTPAPYAAFNTKYIGFMGEMFGDKNGCNVAMFTNDSTGHLKVIPLNANSVSYGDPLFIVMQVSYDATELKQYL